MIIKNIFVYAGYRTHDLCVQSEGAYRSDTEVLKVGRRHTQKHNNLKSLFLNLFIILRRYVYIANNIIGST